MTEAELPTTPIVVGGVYESITADGVTPGLQAVMVSAQGTSPHRRLYMNSHTTGAYTLHERELAMHWRCIAAPVPLDLLERLKQIAFPPIEAKKK